MSEEGKYWYCLWATIIAAVVIIAITIAIVDQSGPRTDALKKQCIESNGHMITTTSSGNFVCIRK